MSEPQAAGTETALGTRVGEAQTEGVRSYGQFCPIARASEVLAERWTPIIVRNILDGCQTFNEIAAGAPGLSRALLARRLHELELAGVIEIRPKRSGRGSLYLPTESGRAVGPVLVVPRSADNRLPGQTPRVRAV